MRETEVSRLKESKNEVIVKNKKHEIKSN